MLNVESLGSYNSGNILGIEEAATKITRFKEEKKKVGVCHGGFDLLHPGHVKHFESAKKLCDVLFVTITADKYIPSRKGDGRPIYPEQLRAYIIASIKYVDYVVIIDDATALTMLRSLKPSFYIKGEDFINKSTPGITAEREVIKAVGGEMVYTKDPKMGTTEIIDYIKTNISDKKVLIGIDRDGTLIKNDDYFGKDDDWKNEIEYNDDVISLLSYLQTKYKTIKIVVTNQQGVARNYFSCKRVEEINSFINDELKKRGVAIDNWQYCPDADKAYAELKKKEIHFNMEFVKEVTRRKPAPNMLLDGLKSLNMDIKDFESIMIIGDRDDDKILADNVKGKFIDVKGKNYEELLGQLK